MNSPTTSSTENLLQRPLSQPLKEDKTSQAASKQPSSSSTNPLQNSPQEDSSDAPLKPSQKASQPKTAKEIVIFDKKQKKYLLLYVCWLLWCIHACFSTLPSSFHNIFLEDFHFDFEGFMDKMRAPLIVIAPFWFQFIAIYLKDVLIMEIGIGLVRIYGLIVGIPMAIAGFLYLYSPEIHADFYNAPVEQSEKVLLEIVRRTGKMFLYLLVTHVTAKKYQNYLIQREELVKKNQ